MDHSILLIDDEEILRKTLSDDLEEEGFHVTTAVNGEEGLEQFKTQHPDLVIVDLIMEGMNGIQVSQEIKKLQPNAPVMILTGHGTLESAIDALQLKVQDYILKPVKRDELLSKITSCLENTPPRRTLKNRKPAYSQNLQLEKVGLTKRQREVANLASQGYNDEEIAQILKISVFTVKFHLKKAFKKLNIHKRVELILSSN
ncbi:response regulator transcription factor [Nitrospina gracilis]|uniref:response regulator transcription factor n=1 Tax=Nitrospina gracilis TaxID=35801 RepID=UPI001F370D82|nr:response regulator transcription factor [Nitrospina gracilis]MCF8720953.1 two-component system nitrogen regulation response regulator NtrX [Nitrospina gracilis Nb-211]